MPYNSPRRRRNPEIVHAWLIGTGVPSLAAAVHLICDAKVRASQIHILDADAQTENDVKNSGHLERGCHLPVDFFSCTLEKCTAELLSNIPSQCLEHNSLLECLVTESNGEQPQGHESAGFAYWEESGIRTRQHDLRMKDRKDVLKFMLDSELRYDSKIIEELFSQSFFDSDFWNGFSARFALHPWHSAVEFHRYLCKYAEFSQRGEIKVSLPAQYNMLASIAQPLEQFLRYQGVHFETGKLVSNLEMLPKSDPIYVSEIEYAQDEKRVFIPVGPDDIVIATLGSITSGSLIGCNRDPPPPISSSAERVLNGYWSLWFRLAKQSSRKFGDPSAFCTHIPQSRIETFTITLQGEESLALHTTLTDLLEENAFISFSRSNWLLCVFLPQQPSLRAQKGPFAICGYALLPAAHGNFIKKPMCRCSGEEILFELFTHLGIPFEKTSTTATSIPCLMPFATSMMLIHNQGDRPEVIPPDTTNIAVIGQYSEIKDETAFGIEYSVRSAQMAVYGLMGLDKSPPKVNKNVVARRYGDSGFI